MMQIPYVTPDQDPTVIDQADQLVQKMKGLVNLLSHPSQKYRLLTVDDRQKLMHLKYPTALVNNVVFFTERVRQEQDGKFVESDQQMVGFTSAAFRTELYANEAIKSTLVKSHYGRCAYCETLIQQSEYGDVEHFRPKTGYTNAWSNNLFRPAYYQLAYDPRNLFYSCSICNQAYKKNYFEVIGGNQINAPETEQAILINPYLEDPRRYIRFNPLNGRAYPFDLVAAFYSQTKGWSIERTSQELWTKPRMIPGQSNSMTVATSDYQIDQDFQLWLQDAKDISLRRGSSNISVLGLNRTALIKSRVGHLRHMRGLLWASQGQGTDKGAANQFLQGLLENPISQNAITPQYTSLSIDAIQTWNAEGIPGEFAWVESYDRMLEQFNEEPSAVETEAYNDAFCFMLFEHELRLAGRRRLVYISDSDKVYGNPMGRRAIFLAIDWSSEQDNSVLMMQGQKLMRRMTIRELLDEARHNPQIYRQFQRYEIWVTGNFPPFKS